MWMTSAKMLEQLFLSVAILGVGMCVCICVCVWPIWYHGNKMRKPRTLRLSHTGQWQNWTQIDTKLETVFLFFSKQTKRSLAGRTDTWREKERDEDRKNVRKKAEGRMKGEIKLKVEWGLVRWKLIHRESVYMCVVLAGCSWILCWPLQR